MSDLQAAHQHFIQGMSRISHFWGFPKAMGAIFGALYLAPEALSLDELVAQVGVTKGAVSTNVRRLERLGMVQRQVRLGERKDYYTAETDFWGIIKGLLREREKGEFDRALSTVGESLQMLAAAEAPGGEPSLARHYQARLQNMQAFFHTLDNLVAMVMTLDELRVGSLQRLFGRAPDRQP
jgi:DNA-binding transcriptional regulator GbsR (MarR family)